MSNLSLVDQPLDGAGDILDRDSSSWLFPFILLVMTGTQDVSEAMSMTKRYFTSLLSKRSNAELMS
jgi:hypothetical protein